MTKKLDNFVAKMSKKEKLVAGFAVAAILIAFLDHVVFRPLFVRMAALDEQIKTQQMLIRKNSKVLAQKNLIQAQDKEYSVYAIQAKSQEEELSGILKDIENLGSKAPVALAEIKPTGTKEEAVSKKYTVSLTCEATMEQLANFMYLIENSPTLFTIDNYSLAIKDREKGTLKCTMAISKVVVQ